MASATIIPGLAGVAEAVADAFAERQADEMTSEDVRSAVLACAFLRQMFAMARHSIEKTLSQGVNARLFATKYEQSGAALESILATMRKVVATVRARSDSQQSGELLSAYQGLHDDVVALQNLIGEALAKANSPARPIDLNRVRETEAAYARGETKPFRRSTHG